MNNLTVIKLGGPAIGRYDVVKNIPEKVFSYLNTEKVLFVCSAPEGVTRKLIYLYDNVGNKKKRDFILSQLNDELNDLLSKIFRSNHVSHAKNEVGKILSSLKKNLIERPDFATTLSYGEILGSTIFSMYLGMLGNINFLFNAQGCIRTFGELDYSELNIEKSVKFTNKLMPERLKRNNILVTQGFIGQDYLSGLTTVLPLNGSDLSAALFAHALSADYMIFLKDVPGVLVNENGERDDPLNIISEMTYSGYLGMFKNKDRYPVYPEAIELLGINKIPTRILSFYNLKAYGTEISTDQF